MKRRLLLIAALILPACDLNQFNVNLTAPILKEASRAMAQESDVQLARAAAPASLKTVEGFWMSSPENRYLLHTLSQGYIEFAFAFLEDDLESLPDDDKHADERALLTARATEMYDRALDYSLRYVATDDRHFRAAFKKDAATTEAEAKKLDRDSTAGLLFAGIALASSINLNRNDVGRVVDLPKAIAMVKRSYQLDPKFYNGGAAMTLGLVYSSQGKAMGGDPDAAKKYFEESIAVNGGKFLMPRVMMARFYAVVTQDRPLFESMLKAVLATPPDILPAERLANELAKRRAARYLAHAEDYF
jgi:tetratricopeptide (TPR) repeat protein